MAETAHIGALARALNAYGLTKGTHVQKLEAALKAADPNQPVLPVFETALRTYDDTYADRDPQLHAALRAAFAAMWFVENVSEDAPDRQDIFFKVCEIAGEAQ